MSILRTPIATGLNIRSRDSGQAWGDGDAGAAGEEGPVRHTARDDLDAPARKDGAAGDAAALDLQGPARQHEGAELVLSRGDTERLAAGDDLATAVDAAGQDVRRDDGGAALASSMPPLDTVALLAAAPDETSSSPPLRMVADTDAPLTTCTSKAT